MRSVPPGGRCLWRSLHPVTCSWLNQRWALSVSGIGGAAAQAPKSDDTTSPRATGPAAEHA